MKIVTRKHALAHGLKRYFTGKPCARGHIATRDTGSRQCTACRAEADRRQYYRKHEAEKARGRAKGRRQLPEPTRPCPERCELCGALPGKRALHLDHDHKTGAFRGWLCAQCNTSLGKFGDDIAGMQRAVAYLRRNTQSCLPSDPEERKRIPLATGLLDYFPASLAEVARVSWVGNQQHNPGEPLHWARGKSMDQADALLRHFEARGGIDVDGLRESAKMAWRALALLQLELEEAGAPLARGAR